jgi:hypothetical protein
MGSVASPYPIPAGVSAIPQELLDTRTDAEIDHEILSPKPVTDVKNIWFYWHNGYARMHPYGKRTVRAWHCRFAKKGWVVRVVDREPSSPLNIANYIDVNDFSMFPRAFTEATVAGTYGVQHTSDLVRFPLLLKYGGVYSDVGMIQIGDLDRLWNETIGNPDSPYDILTYNAGGAEERSLTNYFLASGPNNPLFLRAHRLLLALWAEDGGKTTTNGMHASPLLKKLPVSRMELSFEENGRVYGPEEVSIMLADYIIQGQAITMAQCIRDPQDGWDGPKYSAEHIYAIEYMVGSQLINQMTAWDGPKQHALMSLPLPGPGEQESEDQKLAREIVEACLSRSFGFKLATGLILRVMGDTLSSLWRKHEGSDNVPGTYGHWLRHGARYWTPDALPDRLEFEVLEPVKVGPLLSEE